jgi:hypothetical protein
MEPKRFVPRYPLPFYLAVPVLLGVLGWSIFIALGNSPRAPFGWIGIALFSASLVFLGFTMPRRITFGDAILVQTYLGNFSLPYDAIKAYDLYSIKLKRRGYPIPIGKMKNAGELIGLLREALETRGIEGFGADKTLVSKQLEVSVATVFAALATTIINLAINVLGYRKSVHIFSLDQQTGDFVLTAILFLVLFGVIYFVRKKVRGA